MSHRLSAVTIGALAAVAQWAVAPLPGELFLGYEAEEGVVTAMPTWTSPYWLAAAAVFGAVIAISLIVWDRRSARGEIVLVGAATLAYGLTILVVYTPHLSSAWWFSSLLLALGFSGSLFLAAAVAFGASRLARNRAATATTS